MTSTRRWKLLCGVLTALTVYSWTRHSPAERASAAPVARVQAFGHRPVRVAASALGTSTEEIVAQLLESHSQSEMRRLAEQLGAVGDDAAIDAVMRLVSDPRPGVPELVIAAFGTIGTDHAVEVLVGLAGDPREGVKYAAIYALGSTGNARAETFLVNLARRNDTAAIQALGDLATDKAIEVLYKIASVGGGEAAESAISTLGSVDTAAAIAALSRLIDSPSMGIASLALAAVKNVDEAMLAKLTAIVKTGEVQLAKPATLAIAHVGPDAIPLLQSLAVEASTTEIRVAAVQALGTIQDGEVVETLSKLVDAEDDEVAREATRSLAQFDDPEARDVLVNAALGDRAEVTRAVDALITLQGPDIEQALMEVAKAEEYGADRALAHLLSHDNAEAIDLAVARAASGSADDRLTALTMLADAATEATSARLIAIVRGEHGEVRTRALEVVTRTRPGDPAVMELLRDSLNAGDADEQRAAASALGRVGTDEARDALVSALMSSDSDVRYAALAALSSYRLDEPACAAIYSAAQSDTDLMSEAMRKLLQAGSPYGLRLAETALQRGSTMAIRTLQWLAEANPPGALELIVRSVRASDEYVRLGAVRAIGQLRPANAVDLAADALRDSSAQVRETAVVTLSQLGGDRARDALLTMTRSSLASDRLVALQYLPDDSTTQLRVRDLVSDPDGTVAYYAMRSLAATATGAQLLRAVVFDSRRSEETRYDAASLLENYGRLDEATEAWLDRARYERNRYYYD